MRSMYPNTKRQSLRNVQLTQPATVDKVLSLL